MSFTADISKFVAKANGNVDQVVRKVTLDLARSVVLKSPVGNPDLWKSPAPPGYVGGRFRANWVFGVGRINTTTTADEDESGNMTISKLAAAINATSAGGQTYLSNSLEYAIELEYGHSQQAPQGMVRTTLIEFQQFVNRAASSLR